ncbi:glutamyl-tRNA reductase [Bacillus sp. NEB1478]|uniref:glutamyl-tRNA reductase n=1 Tax=Bacillus sp. NEB1478 TaxID=3073816 RepID=UPI002873DC64|nr:glutamyl-tRNA reductase [Bacillus sp. NEB1478]WNB93251.1 glutamyl-tRNA reductase [Bacillus sp. NEB1478]
MHILMVGINYKTAPVEIREKVSFQPADMSEAISRLRKQKSILECVIVSTCNRTEIYAVADQLHTGRYYIKSFIAEYFGLEVSDLSPFLTIKNGEAAVEHLFRVSSGLDSMVIGETQILGQVKDSFLEAQNLSATGTIFNKLMKQAITFAKKCHSETDIGENAVSVSYAAVELAKKIFGGLQNKTILIVGAGKMGELTAKHLHSSGGNEVLVINRTFEKAKEVAEKFHGTAHPIEHLDQLLVRADIVISSTGASDFVITKDTAAPAVKKRKGLPLFMVDIAVPRDLDPALHDLDSVFLYDIDDLEGIVESNLAERKKEAEKIELMIEAEIVSFQSWISLLGVVPLISALRDKALTIQAETMESIERKMPDLTDRERKILSKHTKSIVNQLLREPVTKAKEMAGQPHAEEQLQLFTEIFGLEEYVDKQKQLETELADQRSESISLADKALNPLTART